jgi:plasmid stabilization system protein ParE
MAKSKRCVLLPSAKQDVKAAFSWYENQRPGLGDAFLKRVKECLAAIKRMPTGFQPVGEDVRRAVVKQFPYVIFFKIEDDAIYVYAVFHASQDPKKWMDRMHEY